jgi:hypothetical protein
VCVKVGRLSITIEGGVFLMATPVFPWKYNVYLESNKYLDIFKCIHDLCKCHILVNVIYL